MQYFSGFCGRCRLFFETEAENRGDLLCPTCERCDKLQKVKSILKLSKKPATISSQPPPSRSPTPTSSFPAPPVSSFSPMPVASSTAPMPMPPRGSRGFNKPPRPESSMPTPSYPSPPGTAADTGQASARKRKFVPDEPIEPASNSSPPMSSSRPSSPPLSSSSSFPMPAPGSSPPHMSSPFGSSPPRSSSPLAGFSSLPPSSSSSFVSSASTAVYPPILGVPSSSSSSTSSSSTAIYPPPIAVAPFFPPAGAPDPLSPVLTPQNISEALEALNNAAGFAAASENHEVNSYACYAYCNEYYFNSGDTETKQQNRSTSKKSRNMQGHFEHVEKEDLCKLANKIDFKQSRNDMYFLHAEKKALYYHRKMSIIIIGVSRPMCPDNCKIFFENFTSKYTDKYIIIADAAREINKRDKISASICHGLKIFYRGEMVEKNNSEIEVIIGVGKIAQYFC